MCRREAGEEFISVGEYNVCKQGERKEIDANQTILPSSSCSFFCACTSACQCLFSLCPRRPPHPSWCASHVPLCPPHLHAFGRNVTPNIAVNHSLLVVVTYETPFPPQIQQQKTPKGRLHRSAMPRTCPDPGRRRSSIFTEKNQRKRTTAQLNPQNTWFAYLNRRGPTHPPTPPLLQIPHNEKMPPAATALATLVLLGAVLLAHTSASSSFSSSFPTLSLPATCACAWGACEVAFYFYLKGIRKKLDVLTTPQRYVGG